MILWVKYFPAGLRKMGDIMRQLLFSAGSTGFFAGLFLVVPKLILKDRLFSDIGTVCFLSGVLFDSIIMWAVAVLLLEWNQKPTGAMKILMLLCNWLIVLIVWIFLHF
jgi:hypothetical protein